MKLRIFVICLSSVFTLNAFASAGDEVLDSGGNRVSCADYLTSILRQNRFLANSTVIPVLPLDSLFVMAGAKFGAKDEFFNFANVASSSPDRQAKVLVYIEGLIRERQDHLRFLTEIAAYGVKTTGQKIPVKPRIQGSEESGSEGVSTSYYLILQGPARLVLDVIGHPAVTTVLRIIVDPAPIPKWRPRHADVD